MNRETNTQPAKMATSSLLSYPLSVHNPRVRDWYAKDGQVDPSTLNTQQRQATQLLKLKDSQMPTPLQIMALIQQDDPVIHNPAWSNGYLPMVCPTTVALEEVNKHFYRYHDGVNVSVTRPIKGLPPLTMASKKLMFCLGYMLHVLWIKVKRPELWDTRDDNEEESFFRSKINKWHLTRFVRTLCQVMWNQRLLTASPQAVGTVESSLSQEREGSEMVELPPFEFEVWKKSKEESSSMDNRNKSKWRGLEGALATMWRIFAHKNEKVFKPLRDWEFIRLSREEEQWFGVAKDGPCKLSPMTLGLQEAMRVQNHWENETQWVDPMYPAEWEGWDVI